MSENIIRDKTFDFAVRIIRLYQYLNKNYKIYSLARQVLRSGTSIGANVEEAIGGNSLKLFKHKITISYKEAQETKYWIRLLHKTGYINEEMKKSLLNDLNQIIKILGKILSTTSKKVKRQ